MNIQFITIPTLRCEESEGSGLADLTEAALTRTFHHNCVVPTLLTKLFYPALQRASRANSAAPLTRRRAAVVHMISEAGTLGDYFEETRGRRYGYSASLAAMIMSMKTMSYEFNKRKDGILAFAVITNTPHVTSSVPHVTSSPSHVTSPHDVTSRCYDVTSRCYDVTSRCYDVTVTRDAISKVVHAAGETEHGKCLHYLGGRDVSY